MFSHGVKKKKKKKKQFPLCLNLGEKTKGKWKEEDV